MQKKMTTPSAQPPSSQSRRPPAASDSALAPLQASTLLGIFQAALDSSLVERGAAQAIELLGSADEFWQALALHELQRMATAGNPQAQAELAWRCATASGGMSRSAAQAVRWASLSAEQHCPAGAAMLGWLLYHGIGLPRDLQEAARLFAQAAAREDVRGLSWLGLCQLHGHGMARDAHQALENLRLAVAKGSPQSGMTRLAQYWLGRIHYFGVPDAIAVDFATAVHWLQQATADPQHTANLAQTTPAAQELLARCYFFGRGVPAQRDQALRLWRLAAEQGDAQAMYCVGMCLYAGEGAPQDGLEAVRWLRAAARQQMAGAMFLLGQCYVFGVGVRQDLQAGLGWYRRAAEQGNREAEYELAEWHAFARAGLPLDMTTAIHWYRRAARQGHAAAQRKLGHCYRNGDGLTENKTQALRWYRRAADAGDAPAQVWLGECCEQGEGMAVDAAAAARYYQLAAEAQHPHGMAEYGRCLLHGIGVTADFALAEHWLRAAAEAGWQPALGELERYCFFRAEQLLHESVAQQDAEKARAAANNYRKAGELGHKRAAFMLAECYRHGHGLPRDEMQAMTWYLKAARLFDAKIALGDLYYFGYGSKETHIGNTNQPPLAASLATDVTPATDGTAAKQARKLRQDHREALRWYEQAVEQHEDAYAMYSLGYCLLHGQGCPVTPQNTRTGLHWLRKSADLGHPPAQEELAKHAATKAS